MSLVLDFLRYATRELAIPVNYVIAFFVGLSINLLMTGNPVASWVPFAVPIVVQSVSKGLLNLRNRFKDRLLRLPGERRDPAFVMDRDGTIVESVGRTKALFERLGIRHMDDLVRGDWRPVLLAGEGEGVFHSPPAGKWYSVRSRMIDSGGTWSVTCTPLTRPGSASGPSPFASRAPAAPRSSSVAGRSG